jgi:hypothetical protein
MPPYLCGDGKFVNSWNSALRKLFLDAGLGIDASLVDLFSSRGRNHTNTVDQGNDC